LNYYVPMKNDNTKVLDAISKLAESGEGFTVEKIKTMTGLSAKKIEIVLYIFHANGMIRTG
jgi:hypothetical protein